MNFIKKLIIHNFGYFLSVIILGIAIFTGLRYLDSKQENERLHKELIGKTEQYKQLSDKAANLERKYVTQQELTKELEKNWKEEKSALTGRVKLLSNATYLIRERARKENNSDLSYEGNKVKYLFNEVRFNNGPPVGYVMIFDNGKVVSKIYNHEIDVKLAVSRDEDKGNYNVVSKADFVLKSGHLKPDGINWFGKPYPLNIVGGTALIDPTEKVLNNQRFYLWAPRYNAGLLGSPDGIYSMAGVSVMGYGYSKRDLTWKFLQFGVHADINKNIGLNITPVLYRPFSNTLPNTYVGPGILWHDGKQQYFIGISLGF